MSHEDECTFAGQGRRLAWQWHAPIGAVMLVWLVASLAEVVWLVNVAQTVAVGTIYFCARKAGMWEGSVLGHILTVDSFSVALASEPTAGKVKDRS